GAVEGRGVTMLTLTREDMEARRFLMNLMSEAGLEVRVDAAGNIIGLRRGTKQDAPVVLAGSHIDTVPNGGRLDGALGVLAAVECVRVLNERGVQTRHPIEVVSFTNEEGVRFPLFIGSKAVAGDLSLQELYELKGRDGVSFKDALESWQPELSNLPSPRRQPHEVNAFLELHIEQGPVLEAERTPIGIVEAITGLNHFLVTLEGTSNHAGTTPMSMRRDPMLAAAKLVLAVNEIATSTSPTTRGTVGLMNVSPGAMNVIPDRVEFGVDMRDVDAGRLRSATEAFKAAVREVNALYRVDSKVEERAAVAPVGLSPSVIDTIEEVTRELGYSAKRMPSGAGHDAMVMRKITDVGMIFIPSKGGKSHTPEEWSEWNDIEKGATVLLHAIAKLAEAT
ncbi:MAG: M20 family metallo-hydrolase, partial [Candidatus Bathyarchaeia archaeon]